MISKKYAAMTKNTSIIENLPSTPADELPR